MNINNKFKIYIFIILIFIIKNIINYPKLINLNYFFYILSKKQIKKILINNKKHIYVQIYKRYLNNNLLKTLLFNNNKYLYTFEIKNFKLFFNFLLKLKKKYNNNYILEFNNNYIFNIYKFLNKNLINILIALFTFIIYIKRTNFYQNKINVKLFKKNENTTIKLKDIAGLKNVKKEIKDVVNFLKNKKKYNKLGGIIPKGILLIGPPGTGKTMLAKAIANEANVPFFYLSGSDFIEIYVGVGASRVRDLFIKAKKLAPCIIFIDEIDSIGQKRNEKFSGNNSEMESTLNQLLSEMDGFNTNSNIIVIGATNRLEILDKALLRPGRFDRLITIDLPNIIERKEIFQKKLNKMKISKNINLNLLIKQTTGLSGAEISNICNEAALIAVNKNKNKIYYEDFLDSIERNLLGIENKNKILNEKEKKRIAYHEVGHAVINYILNKNINLIKISIIPRGVTLGTTLYNPEEKAMTLLFEVKNEICVLLGGRAAEEIIFKNISTGALNDLEISTKKAFYMVIYYGFSKIGNISYYNFNYNNNYAYSQKTAYKIDKEIIKIIKTEYYRAKKILKKNIKKIHILSKKLLKKEVLYNKDIKKIMDKC